jgi:hypothetical protein
MTAVVGDRDQPRAFAYVALQASRNDVPGRVHTAAGERQRVVDAQLFGRNAAVRAAMLVRDLDRLPLVAREIVRAVVAFLCAATVRGSLNLSAVSNRILCSLALPRPTILVARGLRVTLPPAFLIAQTRGALLPIPELHLIPIGVSIVERLVVPLATVEALLAIGAQAIGVSAGLR